MRQSKIFLVFIAMNFPKDDSATHWTTHVKRKMIFYGLSASRIRSIIKNFQRKENGVAANTAAYMIRNDKPKRQEEIWVMTAENSKFKNQKSKSLYIAIFWPV